MLKQLGLLPGADARESAGGGRFPFPQRAEQQPRPSEPNIVRWAREQREQEALRSRFPEHFPPRVASPPKGNYPAVLPERTRAFLQQQYPSVDWSRVVTKQGGNLPGSIASTDHNVVSLSEPLDQMKPADFFHEMGHIPDWQDGSLTKPRYVGEALLSAAKYIARGAPDLAGTYGMFASPKKPKDPTDTIWEGISYEKAAQKRGQEWLKAWHEAGEDKIR